MDEGSLALRDGLARACVPAACDDAYGTTVRTTLPTFCRICVALRPRACARGCLRVASRARRARPSEQLARGRAQHRSNRGRPACAAPGAAMRCAAPGEDAEQCSARIRASFDSGARLREAGAAPAAAPAARLPRVSSPYARSRAARSSESRAAGGGEAAGDQAPRAVRLSFGGLGVGPTTHSSAVHAVVEDRFRRHLLAQVALSNLVRPAARGARLMPPCQSRPKLHLSR